MPDFPPNTDPPSSPLETRIRSRLYRIYARLENRIVPGQRATQHIYHEYLLSHLKPGFDWLDLGCGHQILPEWVRADEQSIVSRCRKAVGIDLDLPSLQTNKILRDRVMGTLEQLPFPDEQFNLVTANMVIEHLASPLGVLREVRRVLRPGGEFLFHTPNRLALAIRVAALTPDSLKKSLIRLLEMRHARDVFPTHYAMNTADDIRRYAQESGFRVQRLQQLNGNAVTAILGPLAIPELLYSRLLEADRFRNLRSNLIVVLQR